MATQSAPKVIPAIKVKRSSQPVMLNCAHAEATNGPAGNVLSVIPIIDGDTIAGLEVRCGCGSSILIECVYEANS